MNRLIWKTLSHITTLALVLAWAGAHAQNLGLTVLRGDELAKLAGATEHRPEQITLFYATESQEATVTRGPFALSLAVNSLPTATTASPLVLISHGSGGNANTFVDMARKLVRSGFVVAVPMHSGDNSHNQLDMGPTSWRKRPLEMSATLDALAAHPQWRELVKVEQTGVFGMSAGGHTALVMAGGAWSPARFGNHCRQHLAQDFNTCVGLITHLNGNLLDQPKLALARVTYQFLFTDTTLLSHTDPRVKAVVASVPMAAPFDATSLATPSVPLAIMRAEQDTWLHPRFHSDAITAQCEGSKACTVLTDWKHGGHASVMSPWPAELARSISPLMQDPEGFDRALELPKAFGDVAAFFTKHLR